MSMDPNNKAVSLFRSRTIRAIHHIEIPISMADDLSEYFSSNCRFSIDVGPPAAKKHQVGDFVIWYDDTVPIYATDTDRPLVVDCETVKKPNFQMVGID